MSYLSLESVDGISSVGDRSLSSVSVDEGVGALDDALGVSSFLSGDGVVGIALLELKVVWHGLLLAGWGCTDGHQEDGCDQKDLGVYGCSGW